jgi:hypothetical protein
MQVHQVRRILIVDQEMRCVGHFSSGPGALRGVGQAARTWAEISRPWQTIAIPPAAG